jgi:hypothetical protein
MGRRVIAAAAWLLLLAMSGATVDGSTAVPDDVYLAILRDAQQGDAERGRAVVLCVRIDGAEPEAALARRLREIPDTVPRSKCRSDRRMVWYAPDQPADAPFFVDCVTTDAHGTQACRQNGQRAAFFSIGGCKSIGTDAFVCRSSSWCGPLCAGAGDVRVRRVDGEWKAEFAPPDKVS